MTKIRKCPRCGGAGTIGASKLYDLRRKSGLDQAAVASHLGIGRTAYTMIETGKANMTAEKILPLADLLHTTPQKILDALYGDTEKAKKPKALLEEEQ